VSSPGPFRVALSLHPVAAAATGEVVGDILEAAGPGPDLVVVVAGGAHASSLQSVVETVRSTLGPSTLLAMSSAGVIGGPRSVEDQPALSLWAGWCGPVMPVSIRAADLNGAVIVEGLGDLPHQGLLMMVADERFPAHAVLDQLAAQRPDLTVAGGLVPDGSRLGVDGWMLPGGTTAAVGVVLPDGVASVVTASQHRPVGDPMVVTRSRGNVIEQLAGAPALDRVDALVAGLDATDRNLMSEGLHVGLLADDRKIDPGPGDFVIRKVLGAVRNTRAIAIDDIAAVGSVVQFQVHDPGMATSGLRRALGADPAAAALMFTSPPHAGTTVGGAGHVPAVVSEELETAAVGGMRCTATIGPVGPRSWTHSFATTAVKFVT
jgi:small ligand-binding sensory domain FIST